MTSSSRLPISKQHSNTKSNCQNAKINSKRLLRVDITPNECLNEALYPVNSVPISVGL